MSTEPQRYLDRGAALGEVAKWWQELQTNGRDRAALERCSASVEAVFIPAYHRLASALLVCGWSNQDAVAAIAALAALVRDGNVRPSLAMQMAQPRIPGGSPWVSELRFRRLLSHQTRVDLYPALGRVIRRLDRCVNLLDLAESVYWWGERVRKRWAFEYYGVSVRASAGSAAVALEGDV